MRGSFQQVEYYTSLSVVGLGHGRSHYLVPISKQRLEVGGAAPSGADRRLVLGRQSVQSRSIPLLGIRESGGAHAHPFCYCCGLAGVAVNRSVANEGSPARAHY